MDALVLVVMLIGIVGGWITFGVWLWRDTGRRGVTRPLWMLGYLVFGALALGLWLLTRPDWTGEHEWRAKGAERPAWLAADAPRPRW